MESHRKTILLIDGGCLRTKAKKDGHTYDPDFIEKVAKLCDKQQPLMRVLYYDCPMFSGKVKLPISKQEYEFSHSSSWLDVLAAKPKFAVRKGSLKFRGYALKKSAHGKDTLQDSDFSPEFEQKGVDMRIGLDIATYSVGHLVDRILFLSEDTDLIPALKLARREGVEVYAVKLKNSRISTDLMMHVDGDVPISLPDK